MFNAQDNSQDQGTDQETPQDQEADDVTNPDNIAAVQGGPPDGGENDDPSSQDQQDPSQDPSQQDTTGDTLDPGSAPTANTSPNELIALARHAHSYGMYKAGVGQDPGPYQTQSFEFGGVVRSFEDGGETPDDYYPEEPDNSDNTQQSAPQPAQNLSSRFKQQFSHGAQDLPSRLADSGILRPANAEAGGPEQEGFGTIREGLRKLGPEARARKEGSIPPSDTASQGEMLESYGKTGKVKPTVEASAGPMIENTWGDMVGGVFAHDANPAPNSLYQNIKNWLMGSNASPPTGVKSVEASVDPNRVMHPVDMKLTTIKQTFDRMNEQNPGQALDAAAGTLQHYRKEYDLYRMGAAAKLDKGDMQSSLDEANKAWQGPFDKRVMFVQNPAQPGNVTATVSDEQGKVVNWFNLAPDQYRSLLLGQNGVFDKLVMEGVDSSLQGLTAAAHTMNNRSGAVTSPFAPAVAGNGADRTPGPDEAEAKLDKQSRAIFPMVSQESQRQMWMAQQRDKERQLQSRENVAKQQGINRTEIEKMREGNRTDLQSARLGAAGERQDKTINAANERSREREAGRAEWRAEKIREFNTQQQMKSAKTDPTSAAKFRQANILLQQHPNDPDGYKKALKDIGLNYDQLYGGSTQTQSQPTGQSAQQAPTVGNPVKNAPRVFVNPQTGQRVEVQ